MKKIITLSVVLGAPSLALAYQYTTIDTILTQLVRYMNFIIPALITIAVIYFIWGVISFITTAQEEQKKAARAKIINGLIGLFVIVTFWGIIGIVKNTFGVGNVTGENVVPYVPTERF